MSDDFRFFLGWVIGLITGYVVAVLVVGVMMMG